MMINKPDGDIPEDLPADRHRDRATRADLYRILAPRDRRRPPQWGEPGFQDPSLLAGSPHTVYLYLLVLLAASAADIGPFYQVIELVLKQSDTVTKVTVVGFAVVVVALGHLAGLQFREARARTKHHRGTWLGRHVGAFLCVLVWLTLGLAAFWVRLTVTPVTPTGFSDNGGGGGIGGGDVIGGGGGGGGGGAAGAADNSYHFQSAGLFLALYFGTGLIAAIGGYLIHNPLRGRYALAERRHRKAIERAAASGYQLAQAIAAESRQSAEMQAAARLRDEAERELKALSARLKETARVAIAGHAQDPAVTDAIFRSDYRPYPGDGAHDGASDGAHGPVSQDGPGGNAGPDTDPPGEASR